MLVGELVRHCRPEGVRTILDFGCGTGITTAYVAGLFPGTEVIGCDISEIGIALARREWECPGLTFVTTDGTSLLDRRFDLICCFEVLEHVQDWQGLLGQLAAASRYLLLSFPTGRMRPFEVGFGHVRNFKRGEVEAFLQTCKRRPLDVYYAGFPFYSPLYRDLCQLFDVGRSELASGRYGPPQRVVAAVLFQLFRRACLRRWGDQFVGLFATEENQA